jgi:hypothetical protein
VTSPFAGALRALNDVKDAGVIREYALGGAMALVFWTEPIATYDLDVFVVLPPQDGAIVDLSPIYNWAAGRGYATLAEHVLIEGVPVQWLPSHNTLSDEAIATARTLDYEGVPVRVIRPEYLAALYLEPSASTAKRRERAAALAEAPGVDKALLQSLLDRFRLKP